MKVHNAGSLNIDQSKKICFPPFITDKNLGSVHAEILSIVVDEKRTKSFILRYFLYKFTVFAEDSLNDLLDQFISPHLFPCPLSLAA